MSFHLSAGKGDIAPIVILPGDPLRAKYMAETFLDSPRLVNTTRNMYYYTGTYKGTPVTIGSSGMGCASIGIYAWELYNDYGVGCIIRAGTAGAYHADTPVMQVINTDIAYSESTFMLTGFGIGGNSVVHQGPVYDILNATAGHINLPMQTGNIHSSDVFYRVDMSLPQIVAENNCLAAEMEAFALFATARHFGKSAACVVTVSDNIETGEHISSDKKERALEPMTRIILESVADIQAAII